MLILRADSFAIDMLLLGRTGIWMWSHGRNAKQMAASVLGLPALVLVAG